MAQPRLRSRVPRSPDAFLNYRSAAAIARRGRDLLAAISQAGGSRAHRRAVREESLVMLRLAIEEWPESPLGQSALADWRRMALDADGSMP